MGGKRCWSCWSLTLPKPFQRPRTTGSTNGTKTTNTFFATTATSNAWTRRPWREDVPPAHCARHPFVRRPRPAKSDSFGADSLGSKTRTVCIVNNEGTSYCALEQHRRLLPHREHSVQDRPRDVMIVVLRADKDKPADYDTLSSGDVAQAYQFRGAFDHDGTKVPAWPTGS